MDDELEDNEPDILDLTDWLVLNKPDIWEAIKYLSSVTAQRKIGLIAWREAGKPDISELAPYSES